MKQKLFSAILVLALALSLAPTTFAAGDTDGILTAGGNIKLTEDILVGYSRGAMIANDGLAQIQNSVLINISTEWGVSKTAAIWLEGENANMTPPNLENCTLIAAEGACGYGVLKTSTESKQVGVDDKGNPIYKDIENKSWVYHEKSDMINCTFLPLSTVDWKNYIAWEMEPASAEPETPKGLENFAAVDTYIPGQFTDIPKTHWGSANVEKSYELGLMKGSSDTGFNPDGNVSLAQAITMAARLNSIYTTGTENFTQGTVWYQTYVDYAKQNGIPTDFTDYNATATRAEFAAILAAALPIESLEAINMVTDDIIPDVDMKDADTQAIYMLYRAGILTGNDSAGTFTPNSSITRAAAAAIITRMADTSLRKSITLSK